MALDPTQQVQQEREAMFELLVKAYNFAKPPYVKDPDVLFVRGRFAPIDWDTYKKLKGEIAELSKEIDKIATPEKHKMITVRAKGKGSPARRERRVTKEWETFEKSPEKTRKDQLEAEKKEKDTQLAAFDKQFEQLAKEQREMITILTFLWVLSEYLEKGGLFFTKEQFESYGKTNQIDPKNIQKIWAYFQNLMENTIDEQLLGWINHPYFNVPEMHREGSKKQPFSRLDEYSGELARKITDESRKEPQNASTLNYLNKSKQLVGYARYQHLLDDHKNQGDQPLPAFLELFVQAQTSYIKEFKDRTSELLTTLTSSQQTIIQYHEKPSTTPAVLGALQASTSPKPAPTEAKTRYAELLRKIKLLKQYAPDDAEGLIAEAIKNSDYGKFNIEARVLLAMDTGSSALAKRALQTSFVGKHWPFSFLSRHFGHDRDAVSNDLSPYMLSYLLERFANDQEVVGMILNNSFYMDRFMRPDESWPKGERKGIDDRFKNWEHMTRLVELCQTNDIVRKVIADNKKLKQRFLKEWYLPLLRTAERKDTREEYAIHQLAILGLSGNAALAMLPANAPSLDDIISNDSMIIDNIEVGVAIRIKKTRLAEEAQTAREKEDWIEKAEKKGEAIAKSTLKSDRADSPPASFCAPGHVGIFAAPLKEPGPAKQLPSEATPPRIKIPAP